MNIHYVKGSIFETHAHAIVNPVNTEGVMGAGLARQFKDHFPEMFKEYRRRCLTCELQVGKLHFYRVEGGSVWSGCIIVNFPTKQYWRQPSRLVYIENGLLEFVKVYKLNGVKSVAFPKLGSGLGGLDWNDVRPLMEQYLNPIDIPVEVRLG